MSTYLPLPDDPEMLHGDLALRFDLDVKEIRFGIAAFRILGVRDTNTLLDAITPEEFSHDERLPYWADVWSSSVELARWCLEEAELEGKRILEIGCGLGLAGIAAASAGGHVVLSDYDKDALSFAAFNAARNLSSDVFASRVHLLQLDWRHLPSLEPFDMIIGADVAYERPSFPILINLLHSLLRPEGVAVLTEPNRSIGQQFLSMIEQAGFQLSISKRTLQWQGRSTTIKRIELHRAG